jgi:hypothetical protein
VRAESILITASAPTASAAGAATAASATTATSVAAAPTTPTATTAASTSSAALTRRTRLVYDYAAAHEVLAVERLNGAAGIVVVIHFDEAKTARLTREAVAYQSDIRRRYAHLRKPIA